MASLFIVSNIKNQQSPVRQLSSSSRALQVTYFDLINQLLIRSLNISVGISARNIFFIIYICLFLNTFFTPVLFHFTIDQARNDCDKNDSYNSCCYYNHNFHHSRIRRSRLRSSGALLLITLTLAWIDNRQLVGGSQKLAITAL